jgi:hypothetical protein
MTDLLQQGIVAARAGRREEARKLLLGVVEADERSEQGWLWLSGVVDDPEDMRTCLLNVLEVNPANAKARQGLDWIERRYGPPTRSAPAQPETAGLEREVGAAYTRTTTTLTPVPAPHDTPPPVPAPAPRKAPPAPPTQRFTLPQAPDRTAGSAQSAGTLSSNTSAAARQSAPVVTPPPAPAELPAIAPVANPCPYCGAPTSATQKRCTQCRNDLVVRASPSEKRSPALTGLAVLWGVGGALTLLASALLIALFFAGRQAARGTPAPSDRPLLAVAFALVACLLALTVARGLLARQRWSYYVNITLAVLNILGALALLAGGTALVGALLASLGRAQSLGAAAGTIALALAALAGVLFGLAPLLLTAMSYGDFFGPLVRFQPAVVDADHVAHYNNGIAYRDRGMWYMAAQEWEAAARKKPREANYLHALGLAYARLKQFDRARATLDNALRAAPDNPQIKESRALIDRMAAQRAR